MSLSSASQTVFAILFFKIAYREFLDNEAVTLGFFVAQTKLRILISRDIFSIHHAYAEWAWHFLGFRVFAESIIYGLSYLCK